MSEFEGKPIANRFFDMENDFELFNLVSDEDIVIWDVIRWDVIVSIKMPSHLEDILIVKQGIRQKIIRLYYLFCEFLFFTKFLATPYDFIFLSNRRFKNSENSGFYDPFFESVKNANPNVKIIHYLFDDNYKRGSKKDKVFNVIPFLYNLKLRLKRHKKNHKVESGVASICAAVLHSFGVILDSERLIKRYEYFLFEYKFYSWLLKFKKIKHVFFIVAGIQKGLIYAAKKNKIPISEFQHGDIVHETIYYLYNPLTSELKNKIICPDNFLIFSDLWIKNIRENINSNCITVGSDFFYKERRKIKNNDSLAIISSKHHNNVLKKLAIDIAREKSDLKVYFKLHPNQFGLIEEHKFFFKEYSNITVVSIEHNMAELIDIADEFIAIYSTAMYEILQAGKILYVLQEVDYLNFKDFFDLDNVHMINNSKDFLIKRETVFMNNSIKIPVFFERFNKEKFIQEVL